MNTRIRFEHPFDELAHDFFGGAVSPIVHANANGRAAGFQVDVAEDERAYVLRADLPGVKREDLKVDVENNTLTISAKRESPRGKGQRLLCAERAAGESRRAFKLGEDIDAENIEASLENGVLDLRLPKAATSCKRSIAVN